MNQIYRNAKICQPRRHFFRLVGFKTILIGIMMALLVKLWIFLFIGLGLLLISFAITLVEVNCPHCNQINRVEKQVEHFNCGYCGLIVGNNSINKGKSGKTGEKTRKKGGLLDPPSV